MQALLIAARFVQFAASIALTGVFAFECLIAAPAVRAAGTVYADAALRRRFCALAWASLALTLLSGAGWLVAVAADMSGAPLGAVMTRAVMGVVLTETRFGLDWLWRCAGVVLIAILLAMPRRARLEAARRWLMLVLSVPVLAGLAWAGHGAATAGAAGELHLAGDILHLLGAGGWLGTLPPLALFLTAASGAAIMRAAMRRYTVLAVASVTALFAGGLVNTWFLAGTLPALVGTEYGRLLLGKIALFLIMLVLGAVNLLRLVPRLGHGPEAPAAKTGAQLKRNALTETALGTGVLAVVGLLGILPPGLHTEPGWPFPFRIALAALSPPAKIVVAVAFCIAAAGVIGAVAAAAAGRYRRAVVLAGIVVVGAAIGFIPLRPAIEPAYPTSFYAPAQPYDAPSVIAGAAIYAANCAACHGPSGKGDGPAAAGLPIRPANLTEPHLFAHSPGDLFWWVSHGRDHGVMPGFAASLNPHQRWDVINFILARAAGDLVRHVGRDITTAAAYPVPDFAFEQGGRQSTLRRQLQEEPVLLALYGDKVPAARLAALAAARGILATAGLHLIAVPVGRPATAPGTAPLPSFAVTVSATVTKTLSHFRSPDDGGETELLLDRNGDVRARWTANDVPSIETLAADASRVGRIAVAPPSHAGHGG